MLENYLESSGDNKQEQSKDFGLGSEIVNSFSDEINPTGIKKVINQPGSDIDKIIEKKIDSDEDIENKEIKEIKENKIDIENLAKDSSQNEKLKGTNEKDYIEFSQNRNDLTLDNNIKRQIKIEHPIIINSVSSIINEPLKGQKSNLSPQEKIIYKNEIQKLKKEFEELRKKYKEDLDKEDEKKELLENKYQKEKEYLRNYNENKKKDIKYEFNNTEKLLKEKIEKILNDMNKQLKQEEENIKNRNEKRIKLKETELNYKLENLKKSNIFILEKKKAELQKKKINNEINKGNDYYKQI